MKRQQRANPLRPAGGDTTTAPSDDGTSPLPRPTSVRSSPPADTVTVALTFTPTTALLLPSDTATESDAPAGAEARVILMSSWPGVPGIVLVPVNVPPLKTPEYDSLRELSGPAMSFHEPARSVNETPAITKKPPPLVSGVVMQYTPAEQAESIAC